MRTCTTCGATKPVDQFPKGSRNRGGIRRQCKACVYAYHLKWNREHPDKVAAMARRGQLRTKFGIDDREYDRTLREQNGVCAICGLPEKNTIKGKKVSLAVDHDHRSGMVRGLLCFDCNSAIGKLGDDPDRIRKAAEYVERSTRLRSVNAA